MNIALLALGFLSILPLPVEVLSVTPSHSIDFRRVSNSSWPGSSAFDFLDDTLIKITNSENCLTIEGVYGKQNSLNQTFCFQHLGTSFSMPAYAGNGRLYLASYSPGIQILELELSQRSLRQIFSDDTTWVPWGIGALKYEPGVLIVTGGGIIKVQEPDSQTIIGPEALHPGEYFSHTAWATTDVGFLLNVNQGLRYYSDRGERILVPGHSEDPQRSQCCVVGIVATDHSWLVRKSRVSRSNQGTATSWYFVQFWNPEKMMPYRTLSLPIGPSWRLAKLGDAAVAWSWESPQFFIFHSEAIYSIQMPENLWDPKQMVFGEDSNKLFFIYEDGYAKVEIDEGHE